AAYQTNEPQREHVLWQYTDHFYSPALNQYVDASVLTQKNSSWFIDEANENKKPSKPSKPSKPKSNVTYTKESKEMTMKSAEKYNFYNHVPGNNHFSGLHRTHYGHTFHGKNVTVDMKATINGRTYYRVHENGKLLGWINQNGLGPHISYSKVNMHKKVKRNSHYRFYNHVTGSHFANIRVTATGHQYAGKTVHITGRATKDGWKSHYYKCYYKGKLIGWIYQRGI
ncbi:MAG: GW dipeptide domain-containing protein, partial [Apilactobacillus sp.]|nr:GW dipeptide domain-containing protein [Apilactobacillus sp.]